MRRGNVLYKMWYKCFSNSQEKFKDDAAWANGQTDREKDGKEELAKKKRKIECSLSAVSNARPG